ncbi:MAG: hypothetical protein ACRDKG_13640 [Actinomycetota bacterium]
MTGSRAHRIGVRPSIRQPWYPSVCSIAEIVVSPTSASAARSSAGRSDVPAATIAATVWSCTYCRYAGSVEPQIPMIVGAACECVEEITMSLDAIPSAAAAFSRALWFPHGPSWLPENQPCVSTIASAMVLAPLEIAIARTSSGSCTTVTGSS